MRPRRNDIRVSRKFGPPNNAMNHANTNGKRGIRTVNDTKTDKNSPHICSSRLRNRTVDKVAKETRSKRVVSSNSKMMQEDDKVPTIKDIKETKTEPPSSKIAEQRRRRTGAETYINKRFLYDVVEPPKRTRQKKFMHFSDRSAAALMAVSSANILKRHKQKRHNIKPVQHDGDLVSLHSRHGRRLKPKLDYSPSHDISDNFLDDGHEFIEGDVRRPHKKVRSLTKVSKYKFDADIIDPEWTKSDLYGNDFSSANDQFTIMDDVKDARNKVLLGQLRGSPPRIVSPSDSSADVKFHTDMSRRRDHSRSKIRSSFRHSLNNGNLKDSSDEYLRRSVFASDRISLTDNAHTTDLLGFCSTSHHDHFGRPQSPEDIAGHEDDLDPNEARALVNRRPQPSQEELEEDLLAPQLSILSGPTTVTDPDAVLVPGITDGNGSILGGPSVSGSSRRKSPVRPMQVLRTKASTHTSSLVSTNNQPNILVSGTDNSQYLLTPSVIPNNAYNRPASEAELAHKENILSTNFSIAGVNSDKISADNASKDPNHLALHQASVVRVSNLAPDLNQITVHSINDLPITSNVSPISLNNLNPGSHMTDSVSSFNGGGGGGGGGMTVSSSLLPSLLSQSNARPVQQTVLPRVFVTTSVARTTTTAPAKTVTSVTHSTHPSASNRRRPTILKRGMVSNTMTSLTPLGNQRQSEPEVSNHTPVSRTIGLFTASSGQIQKPSNSNADTTSNNSTSAPTKLLQLVTASSIPSSQPRTSQTASDRLFGRRPVPYTKPATPGLSAPSTTSNIQRALTTDIRPNPSAVANVNSTTPYRYAVVRGSADGKQYVLISNPRIIDNSVQESTPLTTAILTNSTEPAFVTTSISDDTYMGDQVFPVDSCVPGTFKVEINGAHLLQSTSNVHHDSNDRINSIFANSNPGKTTMAAT